MKVRINKFGQFGQVVGFEYLNFTQEQLEDVVSHALQASACRDCCMADEVVLSIVDELGEALSVVDRQPG